MTKRDFIALADMMRATMPSEANAPRAFDQWVTDREALANVCADSNDAFKRDVWTGYIMGKNGPNGGKFSAVKTLFRVWDEAAARGEVLAG